MSPGPGPRGRGPPRPAYFDRQVLTDAIPTWVGPSAPATETLENTADSQRQSILLRLPIEVRQRIYDKAFEEAGLTQHIYVKEGRYAHTPCITDHDAPDERQAEIQRIYPVEETCLTNPVWSRRLLSSWVNHWRCEEAAMEAATDGSPTPTVFMSLLLTCKQV